MLHAGPESTPFVRKLINHQPDLSSPFPPPISIPCFPNNCPQMMRTHMYQGRKRPRPDSMPSAPSSLSSHPTSSFPDGGARPPTAGVALAAPARHYTSTQPDIEDASGGGGGGGNSGDGAKGLPPALFTPEELAPTYHVTRGGGAVGDGPVHDAQPGGGEGEQAVLGCPHYRRACKIRSPCCQKLFTCRLCHDHASDHTMDRQEVTEMLCMRCGTLQPVHRWGSGSGSGRREGMCDSSLMFFFGVYLRLGASCMHNMASWPLVQVRRGHARLRS